MKESLLGHLAFQFSQSPENLATNALSFILNRSVATNQAFIRLISQATPISSTPLKFIPQICVTDESSEASSAELSTNAIADLVGLDNTGKRIVIGEAKFWAGLTEHQPITYLKRFPEASVLLFIAPSRRFALLWDELMRRCEKSGLELKQKRNVTDGLKVIDINKHASLALTSWRMVINSLQHAAEAEHDLETLSDISQLKGVCDRMDETAFLPVQSEELTSNTAKRILQYCGLVDEVTERLIALNIASTKGLRATAWFGAYVRYMYIHTAYGCRLSFDSEFWSNYRTTPLWFGFMKIGKNKKWCLASEAKAKLIKLELEDPSRLIQINEELFVPLFIPVGVEKSEVVESLIAQVREVADILATVK